MRLSIGIKDWCLGHKRAAVFLIGLILLLAVIDEVPGGIRGQGRQFLRKAKQLESRMKTPSEALPNSNKGAVNDFVQGKSQNLSGFDPAHE